MCVFSSNFLNKPVWISQNFEFEGFYSQVLKVIKNVLGAVLQ